jgi:hypothetical protein
MKLILSAVFAIVVAASAAGCGPAGDGALEQGTGNSREPAAQPSTPYAGTAPATGQAAPVAPPSGNDATPPPGVASADAKTFFVQKVYQSLENTCGACHNAPGSAGAPGYLSATSASDAYASVEARGYIVPNSMLLKKGQHEGPPLTSDQVGLVTQWLALEAQVRGNQAPVNLLSKLGKCLNKTLFDAIGIDKLQTIPRKGENPDRCTGCNNTPCMSCHESGEYAMYSNSGGLGMATFSALQSNATSPEGIYIISKYITTNGTQLVPSTAIPEKATLTAGGAPYSHPMFTISPEAAQAITDFANDAIAKYDAKQCGQ